jgi:predicted MFS family arabinose efflux permease
VTLNAKLKNGCFVLEGLNSFATTFYLYYFYFFMQQQFGFGNKANLVVAALNGFVYMIGAWWSGRFAQRAGYFASLKIGFAVMLGALAVGTLLGSAAGQVMVMVVVTIGICFTWPCLEALVSEGETPARLQPIIGLYNVVWAGLGAVAYFAGGAMLEKLGLNSLFYVPIAILVVQLALTIWLEREAKSFQANPPPALPVEGSGSSRVAAVFPSSEGSGVGPSPQLNPRPIARARAFLRMAWLANPFAYIAINTLVAVMPGVAQRLELSTTLAGFCCSVWCFARLGAFSALWFWPGWHYRFGWLLASYLALPASFVAILMSPNLAVLVLAQLVLGVASGLIYYSSLFYSMDVGETKGEHGGIHEAAMGLGNFAGPAVGAAALHFLPRSPHSGAVAVAVLLLCGLGGLLSIWRKTRT